LNPPWKAVIKLIGYTSDPSKNIGSNTMTSANDGGYIKRYTSVIILAILASSVGTPATAQPSAPKKLADATAISPALIDKYVSYSLPGWADAGLVEGFHADGRWDGTYLSRGPIGFSGRWKIVGDSACVTPDPETIVAKWFAGSRCRTLWRDENTGALLMEHLQPGFASLGPLPLMVRDAPIGRR
jgi:hypothetical protein